MISKALYSSAKEDWATPKALFDQLNAEFGFTLDAAASAENCKCENWFSKYVDGRVQDWADLRHGGGAVWLNPPYGRGICEWVAKAAETARAGRTVVCLLPARPDTRWWHSYVWDSARHAPRTGVEVRFLQGRVKFGDGKGQAPFPSVVVIFHAA